MAFEIGERVSSHFAGPGTILGPLVKDEDGDKLQLVKFDREPTERNYLIKKLVPFEDPKPKGRRKSAPAEAPQDCGFSSVIGTVTFNRNFNGGGDGGNA